LDRSDKGERVRGGGKNKEESKNVNVP
jgi:hypothetical protein